MRNFTPSDFQGSGQYLVRALYEPNKYPDTGYLSTMMKKVGYLLMPGGFEGNTYALVDMGDGFTFFGYHDGESNFNKFDSLQALCDYLNNPTHCVEYRWATEEEVLRVIRHQKGRWH